MSVIGGLLPGETPIDDISGLKVPVITTRRELDSVEGENIRVALVKYFGQPPCDHVASFDLDWVLKLHREMFGDVWAWAGQVRTRNLNLGDPHYLIRENLYNLLQDLETWAKYGMDRVEQAARLHHRAVLIHPFFNGNGR